MKAWRSHAHARMPTHVRTYMRQSLMSRVRVLQLKAAVYKRAGEADSYGKVCKGHRARRGTWVGKQCCLSCDKDRNMYFVCAHHEVRLT